MKKKNLSQFKYYASVGGWMMKMNLQGQMEYPSFLVGWILANAFQYLTGIGLLKVLTLQFQSINGWSFEQIVFMYGIGILAHSLAIVLFIQSWYLEELVIHGGLDRMLLRPMSVYYQFCITDMNMIGFTDMIPGAIIFISGCAMVGMHWSVLNVIYMILTVIGATLIRGAIYTIIGCLSYWVKRSRILIDVSNTMFSQAIMYPMTIFNRVIQALFTFLFPLGFLAFYPASYFLDKPMGFHIPGPVPLWTLGIGIVMFLLGRALFLIGLRRYDSAGN